MNVKKDRKPSQPEPEFRALLDKISQRSGEGKGDYSVERYKQPMPDIDTILEEARRLEKAEQASSGTAERVFQAAIQRKQVGRRSKRTVNGLHSNRNARKRQGKR